MSSCPICLETELKQPAACIPCGHTFCYNCIIHWLHRSHDPVSSHSPCPQCRRPVREVQKLFLCDWPVAANTEQEAAGWRGAGAHFQRGVNCIVDYLSTTFFIITSYVTGWVHRVRAMQERYQVNYSGMKHHAANLIRWTLREWNDLGRNAQCFVAVAVLLVVLLLVQDAVREDGFHRGILLPVIILLVDALGHVMFAAAYVLVRPLQCLGLCGLEISVALIDIVYTLFGAIFMIAFNLVCIPWLLIGVCFRLLWAVLCRVWAITGLAVSLAALALPFALGNEEWKNQLQAWFSTVRASIQAAANSLMQRLHQLEEWLDRERAREESGEERQPRGSQSYPHGLRLSVSRRARQGVEENAGPAGDPLPTNDEIYQLTTLLEPFVTYPTNDMGTEV